MTIAQNESSQQGILQAINDLINNGSTALAEDYGVTPDRCPCFGLLYSYKQFLNLVMPFQTQAYLPLTLSILTAIFQKTLGYTSHYVFLTAEPNANKTTILESIQDIIKDLDGLQVSNEDPQSYVAFYQQLDATQFTGMMYCRDELFKSFITAYVRRTKTTEVYQQFVGVYEKNTFQAPLVKVDKHKPKEEQDIRPNLNGIRFSLVGVGTTDEMKTLLKSTDFTDGGWVSRMGLFVLNQSHNRRTPSKQCEHDENTLPQDPYIFELLNKLNGWALEEIQISTKPWRASDYGEPEVKLKARRTVVLKFNIPEIETKWTEAQTLLDDELKAMCQFLKKSGNIKYFNMFQELAGERTFRKAMYYARLLFLSDAILNSQSPMATDLNAYLKCVFPVLEKDRIFLPSTYYLMGIHITRLMVANLFQIIKEDLGNEDGTDYSIQKAIMKLLHNNQDLFGRCGSGSDSLGATLGDISRYITNQYRATLYRQARRDNLEMLCQSGYVETTHIKGKGGSRYRVTPLGVKSFPDIFTT